MSGVYPTWLGVCESGTSTGDCVLPLLRTGNRPYTTRRSAIVVALSEALKKINGVAPFGADVESRVLPSPTFIDDIQAFPEIHLTAGFETRTYQGGGYKDRYLPIKVSCYVNEQEASDSLGILLEDVETLLEDNGNLAYYDREGSVNFIHKLSILSITTDEVSDPLMVGEINCEVMY